MAAKMDGDSLAWYEVQSRLIGLRDGGSSVLVADDDSGFVILRISEFGYLVTGCGIGERDYYTLIDRSLGDEPVTAFDGGDTRVFIRYVFVSEPVLLKAAKTYYLTGKRDGDCEWVRDEDAMYE